MPVSSNNHNGIVKNNAIEVRKKVPKNIASAIFNVRIGSREPIFDLNNQPKPILTI